MNVWWSAGVPLLLLTMSPHAAQGQANAKQIEKGIETLRAQPDDKRPAVTAQLAMQIRDVPPGLDKLKLADALTHLSTEGDPGQQTLQAVADTLAEALLEAPQAQDKHGDPAEPYMALAKLVRYEGVTTTLNDPQLKQAEQMLAANDADAAKADFTLKDLKGKKVTFSELKGKIVLVNFWATWCPPCRKEMSDLDLIYTHYQSQGLVVLSLTSENPFTVARWLDQFGAYHPEVLLDDGGKVAKQFHVDGLPTTFVYDRDGKLVAKAIDMRTQRQFFGMLAAAGLKPQ
ncbi:MAG TPA: TlpA disulfide reductase family protein [Acidobacteriaceae bacterium]|nr:TlpA disulfide reductase family protein [Acidobacteriaceae bacterium]